ncbi:hypothetical protein Tco_1393428 [Tanacetum coccineum]
MFASLSFGAPRDRSYDNLFATKQVEICRGKKEDVGLDELGEGGKRVVSKIGEFGGDLGSELLGDRGGEEDERRFIVI